MRTTRFNKLFTKIGLMRPAVLLLFFIAQASANANSDSNDTATTVTTFIAGQQNSLLTNPDFSEHLEQLSKLYESNNNQLLWMNETRSQSSIDTALTLLSNANTDGLDPKDYDADILRQNFQLLQAMPQATTLELVKFDTALSISLLRFVNDVHHGRVKPQQLSYPNEFGNKQILDAASLIKQNLEQQTLAQLPEIAAPKLKQYQLLKQALTHYRQQPKEANFQPLIFQKALRPGDHHSQLAELRRRLIAAGALSPEAAAPDSNSENIYSQELQEGVKAFQRQNGLQVDGIIGRETADRLNQTVDDKILQIELAMERLRWIPNNITGPVILVNIPAFQLWAFNSMDAPDALNMKVIVGKARKNQTPMLFEEMKYLEFMPYWNIPRSIMNKEILPKLYNDLGYLQSEDIELVQRYADQEASTWNTLFDDIRRGRVRARQRPGNKNPLGKVKFVFPNKEDVYLHDTSSPRLFNRSQRDLSHGCVRVANASKLAEFVLSNQPETHWDEEAIQQAMAGSKTRRVNLKKPIPVLFFYTTSFVDQNNQIHFYRDIYDQDTALKKALGKSSSNQNDNSLLTAEAATPS